MQRSGQFPRCVYTHHIPYKTRKDICNLLDADQSWKTLGGQYIGLDATQITLIGQAVLRNGSPTDELLNKLDSANVRVSELCFYLKQMNHWRALEILRPYMFDENNGHYGPSNDNFHNSDSMMTSTTNNNLNSTLDTPTPSFAEQPMAYNGLEAPIDEHQPPWTLPEQFMIKDKSSNELELAQKNNQTTHPPPGNCHKTSSPNNQSQTNERIADADLPPAKDPGEEIVRMACATYKKRTSISDQEVVNQLRLIMQINYKELKQASNDFSDSKILGNGGFASVYRGNWKGTDVAIKRLKCNLMDQALNELTILNSYRIDNILPIYGISIDGPEACLVYQFMANGSLEDRLSCKKGSPPLTWNQRAQIGEGVAKGLYYLHTLRDKPLVHGDVKSANVLLDSQFVPKLGDFGLARQVFKGKNPQAELCTHCTVSSIHGTSVYLPPEYLRHKILSPAVDVYSYGTVLLEMATGRRAYDGKRLLIDIVEDETQSMSMGQISYSLKDSRLTDDTQNELKIWYELLIKLGLECSHKIKKKRPDMGQVLSRFTDFWNCMEYDNSNANNSIHAPLSPNRSSTARIQTPDLITLGRNQSPSENNKQQPILLMHPTRLPNQNPIYPHPLEPQRFRQTNINSALMSVEEESELVYVRQEDIISQPEPANVEAMIPLLTELGLTTKQD